MPNRPAFLRSMRPPSVLKRPSQLSPGSTAPAVSASSLAKAASPAARSKPSRQSVSAKPASPCTPRRSKKMSTDSRSCGSERPIQWRTRARQVASEPRHGGVLRHDAALAIGHAGLVEDVGDVRAERREPAVLRAVRLAVGEDDRVVLVHRQQALAAAGRTEHRERIGAGRSAAAFGHHPRFGEHRGAARHRAELARDHGRDLAPGRPSRHQVSRRRAAAWPRRVRDRARRWLDRSCRRAGHRPRRAGAEVARRQRADNRPGLVGDAEMAHLEPVHAADREIGERIGRDGGERAAHRLRNRRIERGRTVLAIARRTSRSVMMPVSSGRRARLPAARRTATRSRAAVIRRAVPIGASGR